ncbi:hypothetical protein [Micromonospora sp. RTGN7]|uniref:hypothetical protein n=1 Tax=Micromonospora sp. RTGN7 TaxID=3016526 RepID=UPI0039B6F716
MAQRNSSGRGGAATSTKRQAGNQTPNTPGISESEISRMRADDIRGQLRRHGVSGISALRKPELVKTLARTLRVEGRAGGAARGSTGPAGRARGTKATTGARKTTGGTRKATPARAKATAARAKATPARAKATAARAKAVPSRAKTAPARKTTPTRAKAAPSRAKAAPAKKAAARAQRTAPVRARPAGATQQRSAVRTGGSSSRSVRSSQPITSIQDRPERPGRSLVTTDHDVIRRWARERGARPATIAGTERDGRAGVLTFNLPGYRESSRIREITWDEWFRTFDTRRLNLIYQEQLRNGRQSNFFRTESPDREDG